MSLFGELKRRNVFKVSIAYIVLAWLVMQVADVILNNITAPDWVFHVLLLFLAIGLPFTVFFAWAFEITPEGLMREHEVDRSQSITTKTGRKLDFLIIAVLVLVLGYFAYDTPQESDKSIAVLPFVNMSSDKEQEYFSDGLSEELLNLLTKIPALRITSRSSAFSYKGKDFKIADVGRELNVAYVLEGSVRKAGNKVRITVQLIEVDSDTHLWSETYDRSLGDIFAIQDEIASEVVAQLKVNLLGDAPTVRATDPEAYALFLQARYLRRQATGEAVGQAQALLQQALALDPGYAAAWSELGSVYIGQVSSFLRPDDEGYNLAREAINKALAIDPGYAWAYVQLAWIAMALDNELANAARHFEHALQLEPANNYIIGAAALLTGSLGRLDQSIALEEFAVARDPVNPIMHYNLGSSYRDAGRWDDAIVAYSTALTLSPGFSGAHFSIGQTLLLMGEPQAALEAIQLEETEWRMIGLPMAYHALGRTLESEESLAALIEQDEKDWAYNIAYVLAFQNEADQAFEWLDKAVQYEDSGLFEILGNRMFSNIHDDPRWLPFLERIGKSPRQINAIRFKVTLPE